MISTSRSDAEPWAEQLRAVSLRVTPPRVVVLQVLHAEPHISADQVAERVRGRLGAVSTQAIYDTLNTLTTRGVLRRFEPAGSAMRYEAATGDNHHHLVCRSCGSVADVPCVTGTAPCLVPPSEPTGFVVDEAEVTFWGTCPACREPTSEPSDPARTPTGAPARRESRWS